MHRFCVHHHQPVVDTQFVRARVPEFRQIRFGVFRQTFKIVPEQNTTMTTRKKCILTIRQVHASTDLKNSANLYISLGGATVVTGVDELISGFAGSGVSTLARIVPYLATTNDDMVCHVST